MTLLDAVAGFLREMGYSRLPGSTRNYIRFAIRISSGADYRTQLIIHEEGLAVWWIFLSDREYPLSRQAEVYYLSNLINEAIVIGSIVTRLDGAISFRNTFDCRDIHPSIEALTRFFSVAAFAVALWERSYIKLLDNRGEPSGCVQAALVELDANDSKVVSRGTRKALMAVENGTSAAKSDPDANVQRNLRLVMGDLGMLT